jgi:hypothetical protein
MVCEPGDLGDFCCSVVSHTNVGAHKCLKGMARQAQHATERLSFVQFGRYRICSVVTIGEILCRPTVQRAAWLSRPLSYNVATGAVK